MGKFVYGAIWNKFEQTGGTNGRYGWPTSEVYKATENGTTLNCQNFEGGRICENDKVDPTLQNFRNKEIMMGNASRLGGIHDYCGTMIQDYNTLGSYGRSSLILNPNNGSIYLLAGGLAFTYFNNGACDKFGYPTNDPGTTAGNNGWWQEFSKDTTIYWHKTNTNAQGKWVSGAMRAYHNSLGGTASYLGFPEWQGAKVAPLACNSGEMGQHQNFIGGKIYISSLATIDMPWNDWLNHYVFDAKEFEVFGWPKTKVVLEAGIERMYFETGFFEGTRGLGGVGWWITDSFSGCSYQDTTDPSDRFEKLIQNASSSIVKLNMTQLRALRLTIVGSYYDREEKLTLTNASELESMLSYMNSESFPNDKNTRQFLNAIYVSLLRAKRYLNPLAYTDLNVLVNGTKYVNRINTSNSLDIFEEDLTLVFSSRRGKYTVVDQSGNLSEDERETLYIGQLGDTGFNNIYRDTKYFVSSEKYNQSNQPYHLIGGGLNFAYAGGSHCYYVLCQTSDAWMAWHETSHKGLKTPSPIGDYGTSWEDLLLSSKGLEYGYGLRSGAISSSQLADRFAELSTAPADYCSLLNRYPASSDWDISCSLVDSNRLTSYWNSDKDPLE